MGIQTNYAIVIGHWDNSAIQAAYEKAVEMFGDLVSPIIKSVANGYKSFYIAPDASKRGWPIATRFDEIRQSYIEYLMEYYPAIDHVLVCFGEVEDAV